MKGERIKGKGGGGGHTLKGYVDSAREGGGGGGVGAWACLLPSPRTVFADKIKCDQLAVCLFSLSQLLCFCLFVCVSLSLLCVCPSVCVCLCQYVFVCVSLSVCLCQYVFVCVSLSVCLCLCVSVCVSLSPSPLPSLSVTVCLSASEVCTCNSLFSRLPLRKQQTCKQTNNNKEKVDPPPRNRLTGLVVQEPTSRLEDPGFDSRLRRGDFFRVVILVTQTSTFQWLHCQAPGIIRSSLELVGPVTYTVTGLVFYLCGSRSSLRYIKVLLGC